MSLSFLFSLIAGVAFVAVCVHHVSKAVDRDLALITTVRKAKFDTVLNMVDVNPEGWWWGACDLCSACMVRENHHHADVPCGAELYGYSTCRGTTRRLPHQEAMFAAWELGGWAAVEEIARVEMRQARIDNAMAVIARQRAGK